MVSRLDEGLAASLPSDLDALAMLTADTSYADAVHQLLAVVRTQLGMQVAWVSEFIGTEQVLRFVDAADGADAPQEGSRLPLGGSYCARVLDGRFPALIPDSRSAPEAALLDITAQLQVGSYIGIPVLGPQGVAVGMLCAIHASASPGLSERDVAALRLLVQLLHDLRQRALSAVEAVAERARMERALSDVVQGVGRHSVLQPIVDLFSGRTIAAEGLTHFTAPSPAGPNGRSPAQWFDDASRLGLREELELATAAAVLDRLDDDVPEHVLLTVNLSPSTLVGEGFRGVIAGRPLHRIAVEMTEHTPVLDYDRLSRALDPYREQGLQVAVDDAGAGFASLRHMLAVHPDLVKIDMALVRGSGVDIARRTLLMALADFAEVTGCQLVAEGVETDAELRAVSACGVHLAQGYFFGRPSRQPSWSGFAVP